MYKQRGLKCSPVFKPENVQPACNKNSGYSLNRVEMSTINPDFAEATNKDSKYCKKVFINTTDPRLMDVRRSMLLKLDRPPYRSTYFLSNGKITPQDDMTIYDPEYTNYGRNYKTYDDITAGQITYYIDPSIQDAYFNPIFTIPSKVEGVLFKDPMGSLKPTYVRKEVMAPNQCYNPLSSIRDSAVYREDILAGQMAKMNQSKWSARYNRS